AHRRNHSVGQRPPQPDRRRPRSLRWPMRFLRDALITVVLLILVVGVVVYARVARGGLSTEDPPGALEQSIAKRLVRLSIPPDAKRQTNPYASNASAWHDAEHHFAEHCAVCHGDNGRGDTEIGRNM